MLPKLNSNFRHDGLQENAISVVYMNNNGIFESGDYILFYGQSPDRWSYNATDSRFHHQKNLFSRKTFYFITTDLGNGGKRIQSKSIPNFDITVNSDPAAGPTSGVPAGCIVNLSVPNPPYISNCLSSLYFVLYLMYLSK